MVRGYLLGSLSKTFIGGLLEGPTPFPAQQVRDWLAKALLMSFH